MNAQQVITWIAYNWEFVSVGVGLLAIAYGAMIEAREEKAFRAHREAWRGINR